MLISVFSTAYFAPISYYSYLLKSDRVFIEQYEHFQKQSYRNRCVIAAANGPMSLTIPVEKTLSQDIRDIRISNHGVWQHLHWHSIESAYQSTPYFEYYQDDFRPFFEKDMEGAFLFDFNESLRECICALLNMTPTVAYTSEYVAPGGWVKDTEELLFDFRDSIHPKKDFHLLPDYQPQKYTQVFDVKFGFQPELSILDLLFNMGPESILTLLKNIPS